MQGQHVKLSKGLDIPISGDPQQSIHEAPKVKAVALLGRDYHGLKPTMHVAAGDKVKTGQALFSDKKNPGVVYTAPGSGVIREINRGAKRVLQSVVIELDEQEDAESFQSYQRQELSNLDSDSVRQMLIQSGLWTAMRTRPYSKVPAVDAPARAIFVTAMDTRPLALDPMLAVNEHAEAFQDGLTVLSRLAEAGKVHVVSKSGVNLPQVDAGNVVFHQFAGPHPAGLPGTHIHYIDPVGAEKSAWHLNCQDVIAMGKLFTTGQLWMERLVALAGPMVSKPRVMRTRLGACTKELVDGELKSGPVRIVSGSLLGGHRATGWSEYLGRYHHQVVALQEGEERAFFHWVNPRMDRFSFKRVFLNMLKSDFASKRFDLTTCQNGSPRAMVPIGAYEDVMPMDVLATPLLRSLLVRDTDSAQKLGCLELDEEDLSLATFVCHSKYEYGPALRASLEQIEKEG